MRPSVLLRHLLSVCLLLILTGSGRALARPSTVHGANSAVAIDIELNAEHDVELNAENIAAFNATALWESYDKNVTLGWTRVMQYDGIARSAVTPPTIEGKASIPIDVRAIPLVVSSIRFEFAFKLDEETRTAPYLMRMPNAVSGGVDIIKGGDGGDKFEPEEHVERMMYDEPGSALLLELVSVPQNSREFRFRLSFAGGNVTSSNVQIVDERITTVVAEIKAHELTLTVDGVTTVDSDYQRCVIDSVRFALFDECFRFSLDHAWKFGDFDGRMYAFRTLVMLDANEAYWLDAVDFHHPFNYERMFYTVLILSTFFVFLVYVSLALYMCIKKPEVKSYHARR
jgi:hypothetical protein